MKDLGCGCGYEALAVAAGVLLVLVLLKRYFNGGWFHVPKGLSLSGKRAVITGGNSGIGAETARQLCELGCEVVIGGRDRKSAEKVLKDIRSKVPGAKIDYVPLDLASKESIEEFAKSVQFEAVDYLVNNAGVMALPERRVTKQGFEMQWGVNHLGHFYLTYLLWPKVSAASNFRVINLSSLAHKKLAGFGETPVPNFEDINSETKYDRNHAYSRSKLFNVLFTRALAQKIGSRGIVASLHPGVVRTNLTRDMFSGSIVNKITGIVFVLIQPIFMFFTKNATQGSQTTMHTLLSNDIESGCYYADCARDSENKHVTEENWNRLWQISEERWKVQWKP